ncbi:MAG TPA: GNAT family N-acetyltransferase [Candidatus Sulfotelmatobacter sp.]|nr:GNAT family N-acetyltransferase [Candidatus Sulfotelmatobacter sp.]
MHTADRSDSGSFRIRRAASEDAEAILACLDAAFAPYRSQYTPGAFADTVLDAETVHRRLTEMRLFVAIAGESIVGTIGCNAKGKEGHIRGMAVLPEWAGTGVAAELLRAVEQELIQKDCTIVTLDTTEPLMRAKRFYEKHGFRRTGQVFEFFGMQLTEYSKALGDVPLRG